MTTIIMEDASSPVSFVQTSTMSDQFVKSNITTDRATSMGFTESGSRFGVSVTGVEPAMSTEFPIDGSSTTTLSASSSNVYTVSSRPIQVVAMDNISTFDSGSTTTYSRSPLTTYSTYPIYSTTPSSTSAYYPQTTTTIGKKLLIIYPEFSIQYRVDQTFSYKCM
jgi:hypothetical protein